MTNYRFKTKLACQIARVDRAKFNDAVANNLYECAPPTSRGSTRIFDVVDMLALMVFGRLLEIGLSAKDAGYLACRAKAVFFEFFTCDEAGNTPESCAKVLEEKPFLVLAFPELGEVRAYLTDDVNAALLRPVRGISVRSMHVFNAKELHWLWMQHGEFELKNPVLGSDD